MGNPYEDFKKQKGLIKYLCNHCKHEMAKFEVSEQKKAVDDIFGALGQKQNAVPAAFYCVNNKCDRYGLLTKVAVAS